MDTDHRAGRLKWARQNAGFSSPRAAARRFRWNENTYKAREGGLRDWGMEEAKEYGRAFKVSWVWLLSGEGTYERKNVVEIAGLIGAGGVIETDVSQIYGDELAEVEVIVPVPPNVKGFEVRGESMFPKYEPGDVLIIGPASVDEVLGDIALIVSRDGRRMVKRVQPGSDKGLFNLESFNAVTMRDVEVIEAGMIYLVLPSRQVIRPMNGKEIERRYNGKKGAI